MSLSLYTCIMISIFLATNGTAHTTRNGGHIVTPNNGNRVNPENEANVLPPTPPASPSATTNIITIPCTSASTNVGSSTEPSMMTSQSTTVFQETTSMSTSESITDNDTVIIDAPSSDEPIPSSPGMDIISIPSNVDSITTSSTPVGSTVDNEDEGGNVTILSLEISPESSTLSSATQITSVNQTMTNTLARLDISPNSLNLSLPIFNSSFTGSIFRIEIPGIHVFINFRSDLREPVDNNPDYSTENSTENFLAENIDLSHQDTGNNFGTTPAATPTMQYRSFNQQKCNEYYDIGTRKTRSELNVFIIGGTPSKQKEFPHIAALGYGSKTTPRFLCGGSLISENYVITAAHCLSAQEIGEITYVRLGATLLQTETLNSKDYDVIKRIPHPGYVTGKYYNDIALLQLDQSVSFNDFIAPICLYSGTGTNELIGTALTTIGWGKTNPNGDVTSELHKAEIHYVSNEVCQQIYSNISKNVLPDGIREESQICAGTMDGSKDACQGDSGGPLQLQVDGRMYLVGITSFGMGCGRPGSAGVYTKVSRYIPWIEQTVWMS